MKVVGAQGPVVLFSRPCHCFKLCLHLETKRELQMRNVGQLKISGRELTASFFHHMPCFLLLQRVGSVQSGCIYLNEVKHSGKVSQPQPPPTESSGPSCAAPLTLYFILQLFNVTPEKVRNIRFIGAESDTSEGAGAWRDPLRG